MSVKKVLVIDDDEEIINIIELTLRVGLPEARVIPARFGERGLALVESESPDLVVLDLGLPDMSGFEVLHSIRRFSDVPVMVLTVSEEEARVVKGLEMGANAYVIKPFRQMEFLARLKSAIGTLRNPEGNETQYKVGPFRFYPSLCRVESDNRTVSLTPAESTILLQLVRSGGKPVTLSSIAQKLWRQEYPGSRETIRVHVNNLRQKLEINPAEPKIIVTAPGIGYSLSTG